MSKLAQGIGIVFLVYAVVCLIVNLGVWKPPLIGDWVLLWNPLNALFTGRIVGNVPLISDWLGGAMHYVWAFIYSAILGFLGLFLVK